MWKKITDIGSDRTISILSIVVLAIAIPLTVFLSQQQQEIRQRAAGYDCSSSTGRPATCACSRHFECASDICKNKVCVGGPPIVPTATPTPKVPTPTPTPISGAPTATPTPTPGGGNVSADVDRNGCIDNRDFNEWLFAIQNNGTPRQSNFRPDINGDGSVNILDFNQWFNAMRSGQNQCAV